MLTTLLDLVSLLDELEDTSEVSFIIKTIMTSSSGGVVVLIETSQREHLTQDVLDMGVFGVSETPEGVRLSFE